MTGRSTATIRTELLDVELVGSEADGLALQQRLPALCAEVLAPALDAAFARADPGDAHHLHIERLAVDVADIPLDRLETELAAAVGRAIDEWFQHNELAPGPGPGTPSSRTGNVELRTAADTVDGALIEFLGTGRLPWSFRIPAGLRLEQLVLEAWAAYRGARRSSPTGAGLRSVLASPRARARLRMQFSPSFVAAVIGAVAPQLAEAGREADQAAVALNALAPYGPVLHRRIWELLLGAAAHGGRASSAELARAAWAQLPAAAQADQGLARGVERLWPGATRPTSGPTGESAVARRHPTPAPAAPDDPGATGPPPPSAAMPAGSAIPAPGGTPPPTDQARPILVDNAGVVLLHPFLPLLFEAVGIAADSDLGDRNRAVALLHHLATGATTTPEHEVTLAKVLCGLPLDEPVDADSGLTAAEREEADALVTAAIGHWGALGNTGADALRAEFLMRSGTLAADSDGDWLLRIETRTVDILLDQLPWAIGLVKLPWMDRLLRVEWR